MKANAAIIPAGTNGSISVFTTEDTQLIADISGYFISMTTTQGLAFYPVPPCRLVDTRGNVGPLAGPELSAQVERTFPLMTSSCQLPATVQAYSLNYTVIPKGPLDYVTTWPTGLSRPIVSTLNAPTGTITANAAIVPAGSNGDVSVYATQSTDIIIDINGYFAPFVSSGLSLYTHTPCRAYDSRAQTTTQPIVHMAGISIVDSACQVPSIAQAYVLNATAIPEQSLLFLALWSHGVTAQPNVSALNAPDGSITSNLSIVPTADGSVNTFASQPTHLVLDLFGYFAP